MGNKKRQVDHPMAGESSDSEEKEAKTSECVHIGKSVIFSHVKKELKSSLPTSCLDCKRETTKSNGSTADVPEENKSLYICLRCGQCRCKAHSERHSLNKKTDPHDVGINFLDWEVWCFKCGEKLTDNVTKQVQECLEFIRKKSREEENTPQKQEEENWDGPTETPEPPQYSGTFVFAAVPAIESNVLPPVRGLANLGNTCYFNSVMQCLAQTPFLLPILKEMFLPGENFTLPGGLVQIGEEKIRLDPLGGTLKELPPNTLTYALINTLQEMQTGSKSVYVPTQLRAKLHEKCPQFAGFAEHDSHELLRQLLETVRNEDLGRYKSAILEELHLTKKSERDLISDAQAQVVKAYGRQAGDLLLRPSQVFRGELVSTLRRLKCKHTSDHIEHFLDLSLPVAADKPVHPRRRASSESNDVVSKYQLKKEKAAKLKRRKNKFGHSFESDVKIGQEIEGKANSSNSSKDDSDADNEEEETEPDHGHRQNDVIESGYSSEKLGNGDSSPSSSQVDESATCAYTGILDENSILIKNTLGNVEPCAEHVNAGAGMNLGSPVSSQSEEDGLIVSSKPRIKPGKVLITPFTSGEDILPILPLPAPPDRSKIRLEGLYDDMDKLIVGAMDDAIARRSLPGGTNTDCQGAAAEVDSKNVESKKIARPGVSLDSDEDEAVDNAVAVSTEDSEKTLAPRITGSSYQCTLITCLNSFTAPELLTNNNKVSCDDCTEKLHGKGGKPIYMDASKQLLILNPPAILILHLKRFQVLRFSSRKNSEPVTFDPILDLAPYCSVKCKNSGLVRKDQSEIRYALYGIVQHSGSMHGGHYVAHVKVRKSLSMDDPRWAFLPSGPSVRKPVKDLPSEPPDAPPGKWYYVSDSHVVETTEAAVLPSEAYLLFYERIW